MVRIDLDDTLEASAQRVADERLQTALPYLRQLTTVGSKNRDPRAPWSPSAVYRVLIPVESFKPNPGKRIGALQWFRVDSELVGLNIAFDQVALIKSAVDVTRSEINRMDLPFNFLGKKFTLGELQSCREAIIGHRIDKSSFRRKLGDRDLVEPVKGEMRTGAFRPAQLYR